MAAKDIEAGRAHVLVAIRDRFSQGLKSMENKMKALGAKTAAIGGAIFGAAAAAGSVMGFAMGKFVGVGSELNDMAAKTGASVEMLSEIGFAAEMTGASLEDVQKAFVAMAKNGRSATDFDLIAREIAAIEDPALRAQRAIEEWGRTGYNLLPLVDDLQTLRAEARRLGVSMTGEQAAAADELGDAWDSLKKSSLGIANALMAKLAPTITAIIEKTVEIVAVVRKWIDENGAAIVPIAKIIAGVGAFGLALVGIGGALAVGATALGGLTAAVSAILSPIGILFGALVAVAAVAWRFRDQIATVAAQVLESMRAWVPGLASIKQVFVDAFGGIYDAILGGRLDLAFAITMAKIRKAVLIGWSYIESFWNKSLLAIGVAWDSLVYGITSAFSKASAMIVDGVVFLYEKFLWLQTSIAGVVGDVSLAASATAAKKELEEYKQILNETRRAQQTLADQKLASSLAGRFDGEAKAEDKRSEEILALDKKIKEMEAAARKAREAAGNTALTDEAAEALSELDYAIETAKRDKERSLLDFGKHGFNLERFATNPNGVAGTFSAFGAIALGGARNSAADKTATNTARLVALTQRLVDRKGLAFRQ